MNKYKYGIDFGTSNSSISIMIPTNDGHEVKTFEMDPGNLFSDVLASRIALDEYGETVEIGRDSTKAYASKSAAHYVNHLKWKLTEPTIGGLGHVNGQDLATRILKEMKRNVQSVAHPEACGVVFGVPVDFADANKQALIEAAVDAGFVDDTDAGRESIEFVSEPIAVALDYGMQLREDQNIIVFDYGGGTLDIVIMNMANLELAQNIKPHEVLAKAGKEIGGDHLTWEFFKHGFLTKYGKMLLKEDLGIESKIEVEKARQYGFKQLKLKLGLTSDISDKAALLNEFNRNREALVLLEELEEAKCKLSFRDKTNLTVMVGNFSIPKLELTVDDFTASITNEVNIAKEEVEKALKEANMPARSINLVLLAGGSSYIPAFQNMLKNIFGDAKVKSTGKPMISITRGLAAAGHENKKGKVQQVDDIVDSNYGIWNYKKGEVSVIIGRGTKIKQTQIDKNTRAGICKKYQLVDSSSTHIELEIYQNSDKISTLKIPVLKSETSDQFAVYFTIDPTKNWLKVSVLNLMKNKWLSIPFNRDRIKVTN